MSFTGSTSISSSFFNSSFGELIEPFGYNKVNDSVRIVGICCQND
ncbi:STAS-like domain-containing protein [Mucilaginibacter kameinonensis]